MMALRAAVKWGIGVDNVDFDACEIYEYLLPIPRDVWCRGC